MKKEHLFVSTNYYFLKNHKYTSKAGSNHKVLDSLVLKTF